PSPSPTATTAPLSSPSETATPSPSPTATASPSPTPTATASPSPSPSPSPTPTPTLTTEHVTYIKGKGNGQFDPNGNLTRAEAASMISALLASDEKGSYETDFTDVSRGEWYTSAIELLASWGIVTGYVSSSTGKTSFYPNISITRAEFVTILCRLCSAELVDASTASNPFSDVSSSHWAASYILTAYKNGWVNGYGDGTFLPDQTITRAEAVKVINAVLGRSASASTTASLIESKGVNIFVDVSSSSWYYYDIMEASIPHTHTTTSGTEVWTDLTYTSCGYSTGWVTIGNYRYYVNSNGQFQAWTSGVQTINGTVYYVDSAGRIPLNAAGKYTINGSSYYVTSEGKIPQTSGVYAISSTTAYMLDGTGKIVSLSAGIQEYNGELYYINSDGTVALDTTVDYLYFGSDGAYTTGNSELDDMVDTALAACVTSDMTQEEKLYAAYLYVRDNFTYLSRAHQTRGSTDWTEECAVFMFTNGKGNCYCFASAFMYMARRLGYQAYPISGGVGSANSDHGWVMIPWSDGVTYMFDVELEYAYRYRYSTKKYYNLYKMTTSTAPFKYYFPS
ncbi:MAG: S-layer homology domain-containing protein, partial [Oscillospiraceae bacterium]|nr:S-layer homology domain-containing protein [Oscillospiraceae bacterium]